MDSLLPVAQAPILRMSGGGMSGGSMETLLPAAPPVHIAGMHGGASLLPVAPSVPIAGMHGGADLYSIPYGAIHNTSVRSDHVASFGIVNTFSRNEAALPTNPPCAPITDTPAPLCDILYPFVDRRVQALLKRVHFPSGDADIDMGCGRIVRKGKELTISFHEKAITLLSCDLTGTFAKFHTGMPRYTPLPVEKSDKGLLSWMLGSPVTDTGVFNLITFMDQMKTQNPILSLQGFRQFLSYHKDTVEEMDVLRYAMELYGYRTGAIANTKDLYGLILSPTNAVRRVNDTFSIYENGAVKQGKWDSAWSSKEGFAVFEPTEAPIVSSPAASALATSPASGASSSAIAPFSAPITSSHAAQVGFIGQKIETRVTVPDTQTIGKGSYDLRGVIHHSGGVDGGHYVYYYRNPPDTQAKNWVSFSDSDVKKDLDRPDQINTGYVYLFERRGSSHGSLKGIQNHGNSCWMNAALQMFYHIPEYRAYVEQFNTTESNDITNLTLALQKIFRSYSANNENAVECMVEYQTLFNYTFPYQPIGSQQDAMEFITKVLLHIIDHISELRSLFAIEYVSTLTCSNSSVTPSKKTDPMNALSLAIPVQATSSLTLDALMTQEMAAQIMSTGTKVGDALCDTVTRTVDLQIPDKNRYVIIQMKRFTS